MHGAASRTPGRWWAAALAAGLLLRVVCAVGLTRGRHPHDAADFLSFGTRMLQSGPAGVYDAPGPHPVNYPPLALYTMAGCAWLVQRTGVSDPFAPAAWLIMSAPAMLCDLLAAWLIDRLARTHADDRAARVAACIWLFHPGAIYTSAVYWQTDSWVAVFMLGLLLALRQRRRTLAGVLLAGGLLTKPQMILITPAVLGWLLPRTRLRDGARPAAAFCITVVLITSPWLLHGSLAWLHGAYLRNVQLYPRISSNAFNLPWLISAAVYRDLSPTHPLAGVSIRTWWLIIAGLIQLGVALAAARCRSSPAFVWTAAVGMALLYDTAPGMHERYLYYAVAVMTAVVVSHPLWLGYVLLSLCHLAGIVLVSWDHGALLHQPRLFDDVQPHHIAGAALAVLLQLALVLLLAGRRRPGSQSSAACTGSSENRPST